MKSSQVGWLAILPQTQKRPVDSIGQPGAIERVFRVGTA